MGGKLIINRVLQKQVYRKIFWLVFTAGLLLLAYKFIWGSHTSINNEALKIVEVEEISQKNIQQTADLIGTIRPKHATVLVAKADGMLDSLIPTGQKIHKGMLIAKIDNPDMEKNHQLSETAEIIAKTQYTRLSTLLKTGYVSPKEVEEKKQAWIEASKNLSNTKIELDTMRFYAPFDGIVGAYKKKEGAQVNPGDAVVTIYDPSSLTVDFDIPCTNIKAFREGQGIRVLGNEYHISHIQNMIDEDTHMCPADVDIACDDCVMGASVDVELVLREKKNVVVIPYQAVFLKNGKHHVYLVEDHKLVLAAVHTGIQNKAQIEITAGLKPGQFVVTKGQERLYPGMSVGIYKPTPTADS